MDKVKIQEIAAEAGMSNSDILEKAKKLGFDVKVAASSISLDQAAVLMDYVMTGTLPASEEKKVVPKPKIASKKSSSEKTEEPDEEKPKKKPEQSKKPTDDKKAEASTQVSKEDKQKSTDESKALEKVDDKKTVSEKATDEKATNEKKIEKKETERSPKVQQSTIQETVEDSEKEPEEKKPRPRRVLGRRGITIVKKAKRAPVKASRNISLSGSGGGQPTPPKKKKAKRIAEAKDTGARIEIMGDRSLGGSVELYEEEEVVLLDFSDKNIYEEMKRQEEKRRAEAKKRAAQGIGQNRQQYRPQGRRSIRRGGKKKKYIRLESEEKVSVISIPEDVRVYEFAEKVGKNVGEVVKVLFALGTMVTKNDFLDKDSIEILAEEFEVEVKTINPLDALDYVDVYDACDDTNAETRPPVITIMGHVDHGKTSLLDKIRSAKVADKEAGGITQHVGAYQVEKNGHKITFIDTPGHSAFTQMRARGAQATDIAIIVVAADDGVMPQTKESISHAKAAGVPIIIAINKMDKESANPDNIKSQLAEIGVLSVDWGGEYEFIPVSAHSGLGIDNLLETILVQSEVMELTADPTRKAKAIIVESSIQKGFGSVANIIIKNGTLNVGDTVIAGTTFGRVKNLILDDGSRVKSIGPSTPSAIVGLQEVPKAGEILVAMESEKDARDLAGKRREYMRTKELSKSTKVSIDELGALIAEGQIKKLPLIVKTDVQGSLEAIKGALMELKNEEVKVEIIHEGVGGITESDITLADASENAIIVGFNVRPTGAVKNKAKELGVEIKTYSIIYDIIDEVKALLGGLMSPVLNEEVTGQAEVRETFAVAKVGTIAGCKVSDGMIERNASARLIRDGVVIYTSKISSLKRFNDDVKEVKNGYECGIMLENFNDIKEGDVIEAFKEVEEQASL
ncbi:MAG: translation initiation factor IF-2 [Sulfurovum sp.]|nr:translation initiation factor IF-2 [Sulfurovum sp.]